MLCGAEVTVCFQISTTHINTVWAECRMLNLLVHHVTTIRPARTKHSSSACYVVDCIVLFHILDSACLHWKDNGIYLA
jgi:hypothetical protein